MKMCGRDKYAHFFFDLSLFSFDVLLFPSDDLFVCRLQQPLCIYSRQWEIVFQQIKQLLLWHNLIISRCHRTLHYTSVTNINVKTAESNVKDIRDALSWYVSVFVYLNQIWRPYLPSILWYVVKSNYLIIQASWFNLKSATN